MKSVIRQAAAQYPQIGGIGVTSFGETFVLLDEKDEPLLPAMLYTDPRGADQCNRIAKLVGSERIIRQTGVAPAPMYSLPKLMWVKENRPEIWCRVKRICLMEDYIVYLLSGTAQIDYSLATRTMAFDIHRLCWAEEILSAAGIDKGLLSTPVPTGTSAGAIRRELAAEDFRHVLQLSPSNLETMEELVRVYEKLGRTDLVEKYEKKIQVVKENIALDQAEKAAASAAPTAQDKLS